MKTVHTNGNEVHNTFASPLCPSFVKDVTTPVGIFRTPHVTLSSVSIAHEIRKQTGTHA